MMLIDASCNKAWMFHAAASSSLYSSAHPRSPSSPQKPNLEMPPPPMQPVHQSASAAELAAQAREAEPQQSAVTTPLAGASPTQQPTAGKLEKAHAERSLATEVANKASAKVGVEPLPVAVNAGLLAIA